MLYKTMQEFAGANFNINPNSEFKIIRLSLVPCPAFGHGAKKKVNFNIKSKTLRKVAEQLRSVLNIKFFVKLSFKKVCGSGQSPQKTMKGKQK